LLNMETSSGLVVGDGSMVVVVGVPKVILVEVSPSSL
jgi:hypothetical protein